MFAHETQHMQDHAKRKNKKTSKEEQCNDEWARQERDNNTFMAAAQAYTKQQNESNRFAQR
jgi:hypothetical protein